MKVVSAKEKRPNTCVIEVANFEVQAYKTTLQLAGQPTLLEIEL
jgi:hypothetical protein